MHVPRVLCAQCCLEMVCEQVGVHVEMMANDAPYYKVSADRYGCVNCGYRVLYLAPRPIMSHVETGYDRITASVTAYFADAWEQVGRAREQDQTR